VTLTSDVSRTVADVMVTDPKTMAPEVTVGDVRAVFRNDHVHMVLLTEAGILIGTVVRDDLHDAPDDVPALSLARLAGRTVLASAPTDAAGRVLIATGARRLAVVDEGGVLLGLLCLKRRRTGFCSDLDVGARAAEVTEPSSGQRRWTVSGER